MGYFHNTLASEAGISGDDLNRRHRERRLGYAAPSADWARAKNEIRCIHPGQTITRGSLNGLEIAVYADLAYFNPDNLLDEGIRIVK